jgi:glycosyltransferase involved in cell wall biosynthesis
MKIVFIVWAPYSPRSENLSELLNASLFLISHKFKRKMYTPIKYPLLFIRTFYILKKEKPDIVFLQTPPIFCPLSAIIYYQYLKRGKRKYNATIIDAHAKSFDKPWSYFRTLNKLIMKRASFVIVNNAELQTEVFQNYGVRPILLTDRIPSFEKYKSSSTKEIKQHEHEKTYNDSSNNNKPLRIAVIASFASDEPLGQVLKAASTLPWVEFYITGDKSLADRKLFKIKPQNVIFTGFMDYNNYLCLLEDVDSIMVLTNRSRTMLSGAYEALALEKPLIASNWDALKQYFNRGTIHIDNSSKQIEEAINLIQINKEELAKDMRQLKIERNNEWEQKFAEFKSTYLK